jgi:hypothetical protein
MVFTKPFYPNPAEVHRKEKEYFLEFTVFASVRKKLNEFVLFQFALKYSRTNNVVLDRLSVHKVLDLAQGDQQKLQLQRK